MSIRVTEVPDYRGQPTLLIETPAATYHFHRDGAALASLTDPDGQDWIDFKPGGGSAGEYRGIPNIVHPEVGFHPGGDTCVTEITRQTDDLLELACRTRDGGWACTWRFTDTEALMTLTRAARPHWFLYEGTPGGTYREAEAFLIDADGARDACDTQWQRTLGGGGSGVRGVCVGTSGSPFGLYLIDATDRGDQAVVDSFWSMEKNMTVLGFGRQLGGDCPTWKRLPPIDPDAGDPPARLLVRLEPLPDPAAAPARLTSLAALLPVK